MRLGGTRGTSGRVVDQLGHGAVTGRQWMMSVLVGIAESVGQASPKLWEIYFHFPPRPSAQLLVVECGHKGGLRDRSVG